MEVHVVPGQAPRLAEADDLRRFSVIAAAGPEALPLLADALRGVLDFDGAEHAWVSVDWLIEVSDHSDSATWRAGFDAMTAYAAKQGWVRTDPAAIRGHIVWKGGTP
ncbi:hypothetical protein [Neoroseomonas lacus]|uniref:Uncharacterized protein n=1 Tax=Neoroseomonas lacus TaxID=287609 RepID=A0A917NM50_9PROT|nr:hypothetical protein [Neoroseomonas lacus]GGJ08202.1 hypothetical protein GCM10011320_14020 [Neoroseomonas lacus]